MICCQLDIPEKYVFLQCILPSGKIGTIRIKAIHIEARQALAQAFFGWLNYWAD